MAPMMHNAEAKVVSRKKDTLIVRGQTRGEAEGKVGGETQRHTQFKKSQRIGVPINQTLASDLDVGRRSGRQTAICT